MFLHFICYGDSTVFDADDFVLPFCLLALASNTLFYPFFDLFPLKPPLKLANGFHAVRLDVAVVLH